MVPVPVLKTGEYRCGAGAGRADERAAGARAVRGPAKGYRELVLQLQVRILPIELDRGCGALLCASDNL